MFIYKLFINFWAFLISLANKFSLNFWYDDLVLILDKFLSVLLLEVFFRSLVFILIYRFSQAFWLNLIILWTFPKINPRFNGYFEFLMSITYLVLPCKLVTFLFFLILFLFALKWFIDHYSLCLYLVKM